MIKKFKKIKKFSKFIYKFMEETAFDGECLALTFKHGRKILKITVEDEDND